MQTSVNVYSFDDCLLNGGANETGRGESIGECQVISVRGLAVRCRRAHLKNVSNSTEIEVASKLFKFSAYIGVCHEVRIAVMSSTSDSLFISRLITFIFDQIHLPKDYRSLYRRFGFRPAVI